MNYENPVPVHTTKMSAAASSAITGKMWHGVLPVAVLCPVDCASGSGYVANPNFEIVRTATWLKNSATNVARQ
jgi:hypothetical protein